MSSQPAASRNLFRRRSAHRPAPGASRDIVTGNNATLAYTLHIYMPHNKTDLNNSNGLGRDIVRFDEDTFPLSFFLSLRL